MSWERSNHELFPSRDTVISSTIQLAKPLLELNPGKLEQKFKEREVYQAFRAEAPIALRLDGVHWGRRLSSHYDWPRDPRVHRALVKAGIELVRELSACCGLVISDEVNVVIARKPVYGGRVEKLVSISAGIVSAITSTALGRPLYVDSRIVKLYAISDAVEYMLYRMRVGLNNYVSSIYHHVIGDSPAKTPSLEYMIERLEEARLAPNMWEPWRLLGTCIAYTESLKHIDNALAKRRRIIALDAAPGLCIKALEKALATT